MTWRGSSGRAAAYRPRGSCLVQTPIATRIERGGGARRTNPSPGKAAGVPSVRQRELRRRSGLAQRTKMARKAQVLQDASRGFPVGDERHHPHARAATGTTQNFNFENPLEQRSPVESGSPPDRRGIRSRPSFRFRLVNGRKFRLRQGCHRWAQARRGAEHPMEADVMDSWRWNERGQFLEQGQWRQDKMRRTIRRRAPHPVRKPPIRPLLEALSTGGGQSTAQSVGATSWAPCRSDSCRASANSRSPLSRRRALRQCCKAKPTSSRQSRSIT